MPSCHRLDLTGLFPHLRQSQEFVLVTRGVWSIGLGTAQHLSFVPGKSGIGIGGGQILLTRYRHSHAVVLLRGQNCQEHRRIGIAIQHRIGYPGRREKAGQTLPISIYYFLGETRLEFAVVAVIDQQRRNQRSYNDKQSWPDRRGRCYSRHQHAL